VIKDDNIEQRAIGWAVALQAGLLANCFLNQVGIDPRRDLYLSSFYEDRQPCGLTDERDVIDRVGKGEYDAGAVAQRTLRSMSEDGTLPQDAIRSFWSSPGYSHCCFTAQSSIDPELYRKVEDAFLSVDYGDAVGKAVLDTEGTKAFVPGITEG